jgi:formylglycine-generating enzyme required for sulfatase activity
MSAAVETYRDEMEATYAVDFSRDREPNKARSRFPEYRRRGGAPTRVSGVHCRRNKRWTWGSGRGARMLNTRAFAGAVAFAIASVASSVLGVTIDMKTINNVGNADSSNGFGGVNYVYQMGTYEVTNQQYTDFLNAIGANDPYALYSTSMATDANGGINRSGSAGSYTYSVKSGFANKPVTSASWYSAARFANWLHNGQTNDPASLENGSYLMPPVASAQVLTRSPNATYVIPTMDEWVKGGFHTGGLSSSSYTSYATANNSQPVAAVSNTTLANRANFNGATAGSTGPLPVGSYTDSLSNYGLYEMMGNVSEMTETAQFGNLNRFYTMSGAWSTSASNLASQFSLGFSNPLYSGTAARNSALGFRLAKVEPVPEPGTIALAGAGLAGLGGIEWSRRRKAKARLVG